MNTMNGEIHLPAQRFSKINKMNNFLNKNLFLFTQNGMKTLPLHTENIIGSSTVETIVQLP